MKNFTYSHRSWLELTSPFCYLSEYYFGGLNLWDYISMAAGTILMIIFVASLVSTHKIEQSHMKSDDVDKRIIKGPYLIVRHPNFASITCINIAYLFFFRTGWLIPLTCVFSVLWYLEARSEEGVLMAKFEEAYRNYVKNTGMFFPKLFKPKFRDEGNR